MIIATLKLMRLYYALPLAGGFLVILLYLRDGTLAGMGDLALWSAASLACLIAGAHVFNDVCDVVVDRVNSPSRPLPSGRVSPGIAWALAAALVTISLGCAAWCGIAFFGVVAVVAVFLGAYNAFGKRMGLAKDILAACLVTSLYPLAFVLAEPVHTPRVNVTFVHAGWLLLTAMGYQMLKDVRDAAGDSLSGRVVGSGFHARFMKWARRCVVAGAVLLFMPFALGWCGYIYLASACIATGLAIWAARLQPQPAIRLIYAEVLILTLGSLLDIVT
jgi:geranylgeranylglycerol-phosphate geranylgeranyltransferase